MQTNNKLREALELAKSTFETLIQFQGDEHFVKGWATLGRDAMIAALAEPVKNCDVGTAEEMADRLDLFCSKYKCSGAWDSTSPECPIPEDQRGVNCALVWSQMPYEEGGDR